MATIYVRTSGNDTTGTGATGAPYLTLKKALTVAVAGDRIIMGSGTYAEDSGSGYLQLTTTYAAFVVVTSETGRADDVVITGTSAAATQAFALGNCQFVLFERVTLRSAGAIDSTNNSLVRIIGAANNIRFVGCIFEVIGASSKTAMAFTSAADSTILTSANILMIDCAVRQIGPYPCRGVYFVNTGGGALTNYQVIACDIVTGHDALVMIGVVGLAVSSSKLISYSRDVSGQPLRIGVDGPTGPNTTGTIDNVTAIALTGHAGVIGAGCSDILLTDSRFEGGEHASGGQGLVVKNTTGARVQRNIIRGGYLSGLYLKACQNCLFEENTIYNRYATSPALRVGINPEDNSKVANNVIRGNYFHAPIGTLISWDGAAGDAGGGICDQNVYTVSGAGTFGTVRGTAVSSLAAIRAAWAGYDEPYNDGGSRTGLKAVCERGNRSVALAG